MLANNDTHKVPFHIVNKEAFVNKPEKLSLSKDNENCMLEFGKSPSGSSQEHFFEAFHSTTPLSPTTPTTCSYGSVNSLLRHRKNNQKQKHI